MVANISQLGDLESEKGYQGNPYSDRIAGLRSSLLSSLYEADIERARYYTRAYKQTEGEGPCLRAARGLEETLRNMSIKIEDGETLVGAKTFKKVAGPMGIERSSSSFVTFIGMNFQGKDVEDIGFLDRVGGNNPEFLRPFLNLPDEMLRELKEEILPYWEGRDLNSEKISRWKKMGLYKDGDPIKTPASVSDNQGHVTIGLKKVLDMGFAGIAKQAEQELAALKEEEDQYEQRRDFLESVIVAAQAVGEHAERYADLAEKMAQKAGTKRKKELLAIADRCLRVPAQPPRTFMEALQSVWMTQAVIVLSYGEDSITCPGRVDQFLYPYYRRDMTTGLISYEDALEAIEEYFIKLSTSIAFGNNNVTIGGLDRDGENAVNEVSCLMIEAHKRLKGLRNGLAVRISPKTPRDFLVKACETHRYTAGIAFFNDEVVIRDLLKDDYSLEDARDYSVVGCVELTGTGNNNGYTASNSVRISAALEMALNQGCHSSSKWQQLGVKTPHPSQFKTFDEVKQAFVDQLAFSLDLMARRSDIKDEVFAESFPTPLLSSTIEGCVESGRDLTRGGARYNHGAVSARGLATVANSLAAIRWAVFEEKLVTMEELVNHLRNNFKGAEELRQRIIRKAPKYGNADPTVDNIAVWVADVFAREARKHQRPMGGFYRPVMVASGTHVYEGRDCWATPDGRLARQPISNGISPANGTEANGMTAVLHSVAAASFPTLSNGSGHNMNLNPITIKSDEGLDKFASLIEAYFEMGGRHIQFNPMSRETLKDAQKNPKNYPDLMVKVSGYSYRFVDLSKALQDDIIDRTEFAI